MSNDRPHSAPLAAIAAIVALAALLGLGRHHQRARALRIETAHEERSDAGVSEPLPTVAALLAPIDVNHASASDLTRLPRIGPALAARIIEHRPFTDVEDLTRVPGIGPRTIERLREHVVIGR
jgi:competence ComEA-like helix-hairpin-helix protein